MRWPPDKVQICIPSKAARIVRIDAVILPLEEKSEYFSAGPRALLTPRMICPGMRGAFRAHHDELIAWAPPAADKLSKPLVKPVLDVMI